MQFSRYVAGSRAPGCATAVAGGHPQD